MHFAGQRASELVHGTSKLRAENLVFFAKNLFPQGQQQLWLRHEEKRVATMRIMSRLRKNSRVLHEIVRMDQAGRASCDGRGRAIFHDDTMCFAVQMSERILHCHHCACCKALLLSNLCLSVPWTNGDFMRIVEH